MGRGLKKMANTVGSAISKRGSEAYNVVTAYDTDIFKESQMEGLLEKSKHGKKRWHLYRYSVKV